jgi:dihydroorotate dehydrogenase
VVADWIVTERPDVRDIPPEMSVSAWGLQFRMGLWNAAGMFKSGKGYELAVRQGAGAFVAGTTTSRPRAGNVRSGIRWPAASYARSSSASNWMGLPNPGHEAVARRMHDTERHPGCPLGASVTAEPGLDPDLAISELVQGMQLYAQAGVDYLEVNESCPNTAHHEVSHDLYERLSRISEGFLRRRQSPLPVVVKFSVDTDPLQIPELLTMLIDLGFDGIILGNTSTNYRKHESALDPRDRALYTYFSQTFGGGVSGAAVRQDAQDLARIAQEALHTMKPSHEFHVIRCGGIATAADVLASQADGIQLHQWYTGYYEAFASYGHDLYVAMAKQVLQKVQRV